MNSKASTPSFTHTSLLATLPFLSARIVISASESLSSTNRISVTSRSFMCFSDGKREREPGALIHCPLCPHTTAMTRYQPLDDSKSYTGSTELLGPMQALKYSKKLLNVLHVETHSVVLDRIHVLDSLGTPTYFDRRVGRFTAVFERVGNEVYPHLQQQRAVGLGRR